MLLLRTERLPEGPDRLYELKLDGEVVALDEEGRPSFNALQHHDPGEPLHFFIFDLLILRGLDVTDEPLLKRRALIEKQFKTVAGRKYRDYSFRERG